MKHIYIAYSGKYYSNQHVECISKTKKILVDRLKKLGYKYSSSNGYYYNEELRKYTYIEKFPIIKKEEDFNYEFE